MPSTPAAAEIPHTPEVPLACEPTVTLADVDVSDVPRLSFEAARDELATIVAKLEGGRISLEESMMLWERGEALAAHCHAWLDGATARLTNGGPAGPTG